MKLGKTAPTAAKKAASKATPKTAAKAASKTAPPVAEGIHYQVEIANLHAHLFAITLTVPLPQPEQVLQLPVWIPGSYLVREFARHLHNLRGTQAGRAIPVVQRDKASWVAQCQPGVPLQVQYQVYAFDNSVRTAWLDATRGFFNGTSLFLQVQGADTHPHTLEILAPAEAPAWQLATALEPLSIHKSGFGSYQAADYDTLVDCPVEMGSFWSGSFEACGIAHRFVVAGASDSFDSAKLLADTQAICEAEIRFWHGTQTAAKGKPNSAVPYRHYLFLLHAVHDGYGGLEHGNSTALICTRKDLPRLERQTLAPSTHKQPEGYTTLLGLISHEYFHAWNVKRLRPAELSRYDYTQENYTRLLWFFEGFTSYYDDLLLRRAKLIDNAAYLHLLAKNINQLQQTPGRLVQSVAQASFDAWVKYYRQDENTANATVSYYTKGALVALCLDLTLRSEGHATLDAVMQALWQRAAGGPMTEQDLLAVLQQLGQRSYAKEITRWVHGTTDLPVAELLQRHGVSVHQEPNPLARQLGLRVKESTGLTIQQVLRGGAAEQAGFASGDEWLAVQADAPQAGSTWRMTTLDDLTLYCGKAKQVRATVSRDKRLLQLLLTLPKPSTAVRLGVADAALLERWLDGWLVPTVA
ncbi:MAG: peptidase M61 [Rhodoferax sp.]|nr:peptidase M61 [Rhodoferax sp.]